MEDRPYVTLCFWSSDPKVDMINESFWKGEKFSHAKAILKQTLNLGDEKKIDFYEKLKPVDDNAEIYQDGLPIVQETPVRYILYVVYDENAEEEPPVDSGHIAQLMELGYKREQVINALLEAEDDVESAANRLIG